MTIPEMIRSLEHERAMIDEAVETLRKLQATRAAHGALVMEESHRRGRKSMGTAERAQVSQRMKAYWAKRKQKARTA